VSDLESKFAELLKDIWDEIKHLPSSGQPLSVKMNGAFGLVAAFVVVLLFASSFLHEAAALLLALHGKEVEETSAPYAFWGAVSLMVYFVVCVLITRPKRRGRREGRGGPRAA
jgi:hypothetical protein